MILLSKSMLNGNYSCLTKVFIGVSLYILRMVWLQAYLIFAIILSLMAMIITYYIVISMTPKMYSFEST